ncbi:unnamed protein product [Knipowitschia caucasica]
MSSPSDSLPLRANMFVDGDNALLLEEVREMPKDHVLWSFICCLYFNPFCLGLAALIYSVKARDKKVVKDIEGARSYGDTVKSLNIISTILACLSIVIVIIVFAVVFTSLVATKH